MIAKLLQQYQQKLKTRCRETRRVHSRLSMAVATILTVFAHSLVHTQKTVLDSFATIFIHVHALRLSHPFFCMRIRMVMKSRRGRDRGAARVLAEGGNTV